ncbi:hypothetical protein [Nonomuraea coxensis]|uniref:hypothetical protein n=1 Tax=Nonomuraea coxensis TaxID=404386 RepID=UPI0012F955E7|nr:hypothetical protein [Nonomuraea coxensis]
MTELHECSALLRRTRARAEQIVREAGALLAEAELGGDAERVVTLRAELEQARQAYCKVLNAYATICGRIAEERQAILEAQFARNTRHQGLSGVA